jgi:hypothetical protein
MSWAENIACVGKRGPHKGFWWESLKERGRPRCRWQDTIKIILEKYDRVIWTRLI